MSFQWLLNKVKGERSSSPSKTQAEPNVRPGTSGTGGYTNGNLGAGPAGKSYQKYPEETLSSESILEQMSQTEKRFLPDDHTTPTKPHVKRQKSNSTSLGKSSNLLQRSRSVTPVLRKRKITETPTTPPRTPFKVADDEMQGKEKTMRICGCEDCYNEAAGIPLAEPPTPKQRRKMTQSPIPDKVLTPSRAQTQTSMTSSSTKPVVAAPVKKAEDTVDRQTENESKAKRAIFEFAIIDKERHMADKRLKEARLQKIMALSKVNRAVAPVSFMTSQATAAVSGFPPILTVSTTPTTSVSFAGPSSTYTIPTSTLTSTPAVSSNPPVFSSFGTSPIMANANSTPILTTPTSTSLPATTSGVAGSSSAVTILTSTPAVSSTPPTFSSLAPLKSTPPVSTGPVSTSAPSSILSTTGPTTDTPLEKPGSGLPPFGFAGSSTTSKTSTVTSTPSVSSNPPVFSSFVPVPVPASTTPSNLTPIISSSTPLVSKSHTPSTPVPANSPLKNSAPTALPPFGGFQQPVTTTMSTPSFGMTSGFNLGTTGGASSSPFGSATNSSTILGPPSGSPQQLKFGGGGFGSTQQQPQISTGFQFGGTPNSSLQNPATTTTSAPTFGGFQQPAPAVTTSVPTFGGFQQPAVTTSVPTFGGFQQPPATTSTPTFGFPQPPATTSAPTFGFPQPPATTSAPTFGFQQPPVTTSAPTFGIGGFQQPVVTTSAPAFSGFQQPPATTAPPAFGTTSGFNFGTTPVSQFGNTTNTLTTLGQQTPLPATQPLQFGGGGFASPQQTPQISTGFQFGGTPNATLQNPGTTAAIPFGGFQQPPLTTPAPTFSGFQQPTVVTSAPTFGSPSGPAFNFGATAGSPFGSGLNNSTTLGQAPSSVNQPLQFGGVGFGSPQPPQATAGFQFGGTPSTALQPPSTTAATPFGGFQQPVTTSAAAFGSPSAGFNFGATAPSPFGNSGSATLGQPPSTPQPFQFGGGSGFGSPQQQQPQPFQFGATTPSSPQSPGFGVPPGQQSPMFTLGGGAPSPASRRPQLRGRRYR